MTQPEHLLLRSTPGCPASWTSEFDTIGFVAIDVESVLVRARRKWTLNGAALPPTFFAGTTPGEFCSHVSLKPATLTRVSGRCPAALWNGARPRLRRRSASWKRRRDCTRR